jgi:hypothetical protein
MHDLFSSLPSVLGRCNVSSVQTVPDFIYLFCPCELNCLSIHGLIKSLTIDLCSVVSLRQAQLVICGRASIELI